MGCKFSPIGFKRTSRLALLMLLALVSNAQPVCAESGLDRAFAIYHDQEKYDEGEAAYNAEIKAHPLNPREFYLTAIELEKKGNFDLARRYYFRAYYAGPSSQAGQYAVKALNNLNAIIENPEEGAILLTTGPHSAAYDMILADYAAAEANRQIKFVGSKIPNFKTRYVVADNEWPRKKKTQQSKPASNVPSPYGGVNGQVSSARPATPMTPAHSTSVEGKLLKRTGSN